MEVRVLSNESTDSLEELINDNINDIDISSAGEEEVTEIKFSTSVASDSEHGILVVFSALLIIKEKSK